MKIQNTTQSIAQNGTAEEAERMLTAWGAAPLLFFALLPDKRYLLGENWGVAYRVVGRQALALGDPFGDPAAAPEAIRAFGTLCRRHGWKPVWYQTTAENLDTYCQAGLKSVKAGEDAQIALSDFSLAGKKYVKLRNDLRRIEKAGITLEVYGPDAPPSAECIAEMDSISRGWRKAHGANEGWFAMGGFDPASELFARSRCFVARDTGTGRMAAFTTFVPIFGVNHVDGWTLDLMRRQADSVHGVMDFLIVSAAAQFASEGAKTLSLGLSPLAGDDDPKEAAATSSIRRFLYTRLNRAYNFQGLHTFKGKFATRWEPRFLVYSGRLALASASGAVLKAHVTAPSAPPKLTRRVGSRRQGALLLGALLFLGVVPLEQSLAHQTALRSRHWRQVYSARLTHTHLLHTHFRLRPFSFQRPARA